METLTEERPPAPGLPASPAAPVAVSKPQALLVSMRPQEWIKNLLVFAGLLFSGKLDEGGENPPLNPACGLAAAPPANPQAGTVR